MASSSSAEDIGKLLDQIDVSNMTVNEIRKVKNKVLRDALFALASTAPPEERGAEHSDSWHGTHGSTWTD